MKNKKIFIIITGVIMIIMILLVIFSITITNKNNNSGKKVDNKSIKPKLYLIKSDKIRHDKLSIAVFNGIDNDGRNISLICMSK